MLSSPQRAYIRHLVVRKDDTESTISNREFADIIGVHEKTLIYWQKGAEFQEALAKATEEYQNSTDYFKTCLKHRVLEHGWVEYQKAKGAERRKWWSQLVKETADADVASDTIDYTHLSEDELINIMLSRSVSPLGMSMGEFKSLIAKEKGA
jgi:hypothetical protein